MPGIQISDVLLHIGLGEPSVQMVEQEHFSEFHILMSFSPCTCCEDVTGNNCVSAEFRHEGLAKLIRPGRLVSRRSDYDGLIQSKNG